MDGSTVTFLFSFALYISYQIDEHLNVAPTCPAFLVNTGQSVMFFSVIRISKLERELSGSQTHGFADQTKQPSVLEPTFSDTFLESKTG